MEKGKNRKKIGQLRAEIWKIIQKGKHENENNDIGQREGRIRRGKKKKRKTKENNRERKKNDNGNN